jgi:membrane associated rhomboid family serine protease
MHTPWKNLTDNTKKPIDKLYWLIGINVIVFLIILIYAPIGGYLRLTPRLPTLLTQFWTPLTYMFMHDGFISAVFNLLWLYWMGQVFEDYLGSKRLIGVYLLGGLSGAVLFIIVFNLPFFAHSNPFILNAISGATASVLAIIVATATLLPDHPVILFIWPVKLKWIVLIYAIIDLINFSGFGIGLITAHIGAALFGFVYIKRLQKGSDWIKNIVEVFSSGPRPSKLKVVARNNNKKSSSRPRQEDVDLILDKISNSGYESLTTEEKEILFRASKNES